MNERPFSSLSPLVPVCFFFLFFFLVLSLPLLKVMQDRGGLHTRFVGFQYNHLTGTIMNSNHNSQLLLYHHRKHNFRKFDYMLQMFMIVVVVFVVAFACLIFSVVNFSICPPPIHRLWPFISLLFFFYRNVKRLCGISSSSLLESLLLLLLHGIIVYQYIASTVYHIWIRLLLEWFGIKYDYHQYLELFRPFPPSPSTLPSLTLSFIFFCVRPKTDDVDAYWYNLCVYTFKNWSWTFLLWSFILWLVNPRDNNTIRLTNTNIYISNPMCF